MQVVRPFLFLIPKMWLPDSHFRSTAPSLTLFAAQAWHELLSPQTPDTFQARVLDLPLLLRELAAVATLSSEDERWAFYLPMIGEEIRDSRQVESAYLARDARLRSSVEAIVSNIVVDSKTPELMYERAQIALTSFGRIEQRWKTHAKEVVTGTPREKGLLLHRLSTLATHVLARGLEEESLATITEETCQLAPADFIDVITACVVDQSKQFHCVAALDGKRGDLASLIEGSKFTQVGKGNGIRLDSLSREWHTSNDGRFFVGISIDAVSARMAAEQCLQELSTLLNVQNLYYNGAAFRAIARILVYDADNSTVTVEVSPQKHFGLFPRSEYRKLSRDTHSLVGTRLNGRISNALECHALALSADNPKTAMINLWTALETITGSMGARSTGSRVAERIAPIIAYRRIDKIATYLALSIHATVRRDGQGINRDLLHASNDEFISPDDVMRAMTGRERNDAIMYLFKRCSASPLLLNRMFTVWREFHDPKLLAASMARSKTRVEWQIARIYRARNLLVHRGEQSPHTWRLLRNAHYYVSSAISRALHDLRDHASWTLDTALIHQSQRYSYLHDQLLKHAGESIVFSDLLLQKARSSDSTVWSNLPPPTQHSNGPS